MFFRGCAPGPPWTTLGLQRPQTPQLVNSAACRGLERRFAAMKAASRHFTSPTRVLHYILYANIPEKLLNTPLFTYLLMTLVGKTPKRKEIVWEVLPFTLSTCW